VDALAHYLDGLAPPAAPSGDAAAVARGRALFASPAVGCATCHAGAHLTDNKNHDVGTGGELQTPSLVGVGWRAPFMHDGCAPTLAARFDAGCGGGDRHGVTSKLSAAELADLVAYLESL
jgi:mono/diheme cytochrome c family protein